VFVSQAALRVHAALGYAAKGMEVIPNGFDLDEFKPDSTARLSLRRELGIAEETVLVGMAAHFRPEKDHHNFIKAAARLHGLIPEIHFVLCGLGVTRNNQQLVRWMTEAGLSGCCHLIGERRDTPRFFSAVDIVTSSAATEAFPLSVGEAMACGTPCVVTNVGDSALIVGEAGRVVASRNSEALAKAWLELIKAGPGIRRHLGMMSRRRIQEHFKLAATVNRYQSRYTKLITAKSSDTRVPAAGRLEPCNKPLDVPGVAVPPENSVSL